MIGILLSIVLEEVVFRGILMWLIILGRIIISIKLRTGFSIR